MHRGLLSTREVRRRRCSLHSALRFIGIRCALFAFDLERPASLSLSLLSTPSILELHSNPSAPIDSRASSRAYLGSWNFRGVFVG